MSKSYFQIKVEEFHKKFGQTINDVPTMPSDKERRLRASLILEEALEFAQAAGYAVEVFYPAFGAAKHSFTLTTNSVPCLVEMADAISDINYVVAGAAAVLGFHDVPLFDEVHRSNMSKVWEDGTVRRNEAGKVTKPPTYSPANLGRVLSNQLLN